MQDRRVQRMLHAALERIEVADGGAALEAADRADLAGLVQQAFGQIGLPSSRRSYQRQGPDGGDAGRGWAWHGGTPVPSAGSVVEAGGRGAPAYASPPAGASGNTPVPAPMR